MSWLVYLALAGAVVLAVAGFHSLVRRGLAPRRLVETRTPGALGLAYREVRIATANGLGLHGWLVPGTGTPPAPTVVLLHGWGGSAETLLPLAPSLARAGFAVLLFDARCHGRSDEDSFASMPRFTEDLEHALDWLRQQAEVDPRRMAVVGHSVGGAAALLAASRRADVAAVVSIAAFSHPRDMMRRLLATKHIPYWPLGWYILRYVQHVIGHRFDAIAPLTTIRQVRCPTLLVHGAEDTTVPAAEAHAIYAARGAAPVQLVIIPGSHDDYGDVEQEAPQLVAFLRENLPP
ncbi:MAG: alpha/beta fold hydrolase [Gammaproteobacteria bacterium]|nr:alpha/beta fold hydrolase [Gammaproteobacteria bacterium]